MTYNKSKFEQYDSITDPTQCISSKSNVGGGDSVHYTYHDFMHALNSIREQQSKVYRQQTELQVMKPWTEESQEMERDATRTIAILKLLEFLLMREVAHQEHLRAKVTPSVIDQSKETLSNLLLYNSHVIEYFITNFHDIKQKLEKL